MTREEQIQSYFEQPRRYFNIDGLGELGIGVMMLGFALIGWLQATTPNNSMWHRPWSFPVYVALMIITIDRGTKIMKRRVTYPRTGFVEYRRGAKGKILPMMIGAVSAAAFVLSIKRRVSPAAIVGIVFVPAYAYGVARAVRWKWLVVSVLAVGSLAIASLPTDLLTSFAHDSAASPKFPPDLLGGAWLVEALFFGATMLFSGGVTLYQYLSQTQAADQAAE